MLDQIDSAMIYRAFQDNRYIVYVIKDVEYIDGVILSQRVEIGAFDNFNEAILSLHAWYKQK
jgi:hypothetical protein|tara:strand:- start:3672 stop:3857 length:186 start_codon:yes stop_codon:yes gene_type:complete